MLRVQWVQFQNLQFSLIIQISDINKLKDDAMKKNNLTMLYNLYQILAQIYHIMQGI